jgi:hypothetical protein
VSFTQCAWDSRKFACGSSFSALLLTWHERCLSNHLLRNTRAIMKPSCIHVGALLFLTALCACGQGTFVYDQQSSTDETPLRGVGGDMNQISPPWGQSFTPAQSSVGFVKFMFNNGNINGLGATIYVNLVSDSISGTIIGTSASVTMPNAFAGPATFLFPSPVPLTPGTTYYFEPMLQSVGTWNIVAGPYNYPGGSVFVGGTPAPASDFWFREGIVVPEPSSAALLALTGGVVLLFRRSKRP